MPSNTNFLFVKLVKLKVSGYGRTHETTIGSRLPVTVLVVSRLELIVLLLNSEEIEKDSVERSVEEQLSIMKAIFLGM